MKPTIQLLCFLLATFSIVAQNGTPSDYLTSEFHKSRRDALRADMPKNTVAVFFANAVRNRANDVEYVYHQDPNFYYLTGYKEPNAVLVIFSNKQTNDKGETYNELLYVQKRNALAEQWTGKRLGVEGAQQQLGFEIALNGEEFIKNGINFANFDAVMFEAFKDDYRDSNRDDADLFDLIKAFKSQIDLIQTTFRRVDF